MRLSIIYQLDCNILNNGSSLHEFVVIASLLSSLLMKVYQRQVKLILLIMRCQLYWHGRFWFIFADANLNQTEGKSNYSKMDFMTVIMSCNHIYSRRSRSENILIFHDITLIFHSDMKRKWYSKLTPLKAPPGVIVISLLQSE